MTTHLRSVTELHELVGTELGTSDWIDIDQARVDGFADHTEDRQWIHVDPQRSTSESPFGGPIAHGYLILSLISAFWEQILQVDDVTMGVNYGLNKVRFPSPVPVGSRVRMVASLLTVDTVTGGVHIVLRATVEAEGITKPVCVAEPVFRLYRNAFL
ncbi:MAG: dehydratase [Gordonia sp.]|jgi:acyl dehydratase|nr:dehydratase [Gordonia sp. (in: high G+C Gram-positive bacteria)]